MHCHLNCLCLSIHFSLKQSLPATHTSFPQRTFYKHHLKFWPRCCWVYVVVFLWFRHLMISHLWYDQSRACLSKQRNHFRFLLMWNIQAGYCDTEAGYGLSNTLETPPASWIGKRYIMQQPLSTCHSLQIMLHVSFWASCKHCIPCLAFQHIMLIQLCCNGTYPLFI